MTLTQHKAEIVSLGAALLDFEPISGSVTIDETWSPFMEATFVCPILDDLDRLDPRRGVPGQVRLTETPVDGSGAPVVRDLTLALRRMELNRPAGVMTLTLKSLDVELHAYKFYGTGPFRCTSTTLRALVSEVLGRMAGRPFAADAAQGSTTPVTFENRVWKPGTSAWDFLAPLVQAAGLRLWADDNATLHLTGGTATAPGTLALSHLEDLTDDTEVIDVDSDDYAEAVVIIYAWTDETGESRTEYDTAGLIAPTPNKVITLNYDSPYPGPGAAAAILARRQRRSRRTRISAISNYTATPGMTARVVTGRPTDAAGVVSAVTWAFPADEMALTLRDPV